MGGQYLERDEFLDGKIQATHHDQLINIQLVPVPGRYHNHFHTQIRSDLHNPNQYRLRMYPQGFFENIEKWFGLQDIEVGIALLDDRFVIQSNNPEKTKQILSSAYETSYKNELMRTSATTTNWHTKVMFKVKEASMLNPQGNQKDLEAVVMTIDEEVADINQLHHYYGVFCIMVDQIIANTSQ